MGDYDRKMYRLGCWMGLIGILAVVGGPYGFLFLSRRNGIWSVPELVFPVVALGGLIACLRAIVLCSRSGAVMYRDHSTDGTPHPASSQWGAYTIATGLGLGVVLVLRWLDMATAKSSSIFWVGVFAFPVVGFMWFRAVRRERAARDTER